MLDMHVAEIILLETAQQLRANHNRKFLEMQKIKFTCSLLLSPL